VSQPADVAATPEATDESQTLALEPEAAAAAKTRAASFDDPERSWRTDDDPFAELGPVELKDADERRQGDESS
jgi:hypothetical protein